MTSIQQIRPAAMAVVGALLALAWALPVAANGEQQTLTPPQVPTGVSFASAGGAAFGGDDKMIGTADDDRLIGDAADNSIYGFRGHDTIKGRRGNDFIAGGAGFDVLQGNLGNDHLRGNALRDKLFGGYGNDVLEGGRGHDWMFGGKGNDRLVGGLGKDKMFGGPGNDIFVVDVNEGGYNRIKDFTKGDKLAFQYDGDGTKVRYGNSPFGVLLYYGDAFFYIEDTTMTDLADIGDWYIWEFAG